MEKYEEKLLEIIQLPPPDFGKLLCPYCNSNNLKRSHSRPRQIPDLGTKKVRKFLKFESIHIKCKGCLKAFHYEREGILPGLSVSKAVLDTVLIHAFEFGDSAREIVQRLEILYSVKLKRHTILKWLREYGEGYCKKNKIAYQENLEDFSGHLSMDGTFPKLNLDLDKDSSKRSVKKKRVPWLQLTALPDGTLCAIWEEEKTYKKQHGFAKR